MQSFSVMVLRGVLAVMLAVHLLHVVVAMDHNGMVIDDNLVCGICDVNLVPLWRAVVDVAIAVAVMGAVWLIVATMAIPGVRIVSEVSALTGCVVMHRLVTREVILRRLVIAIVLAMFQVMLPGVIFRLSACVNVMAWHFMMSNRLMHTLNLHVVPVFVAIQFILVMAELGCVFIIVDAIVMVGEEWLVHGSCIPLLMVDLGLVVVVLVVVRVGRTNLTRVSVVVGTLGDNIALLRPCHCEVHRLVLFIL